MAQFLKSTPEKYENPQFPNEFAGTTDVDDEGNFLVVTAILDVRADPKEDTSLEFLVKWKHLPRNESTWEPVNNLVIHDKTCDMCERFLLKRID